VAALFLDPELRVQCFTACTRDLFPLLPEDAGRRITDLVPRFEDAAFIADVYEAMRTHESHEGEICSRDGRWFLRRIHPYVLEDRSAGVAITFTDISDRRIAESELRRNEASYHARNEAFQAAMDGAPLTTSLGRLASAAINQSGDDLRCAFYLLDAAGLELHHIAGTFQHWDAQFAGLKVGADSMACGLAVFTGKPVITPDVTRDSRWTQWLPLSRDLAFRSCWSFPIVTNAAKLIGTFAMYRREPRDAAPHEIEFAVKLAGAAASIISCHQERELRFGSPSPRFPLVGSS
jgi:two-component system CheB/CheR fusion protein